VTDSSPTAGTNIADWLRRHDELPRLERELLLCHRLDATRAKLIAEPELTLSAADEQGLDADARRLLNGEPFAYIVGQRDFWDSTLKVTPDVLIPRPETETLVEQALTHIRPGDRVLDLGTGSGAVAIAIANAVDVRMTAVDQSAAALKVAGENAALQSASINFLLSDWYQNVTGLFNVIVANPPYVAEQDPHLPALTHEPRSALVSGPDGLNDLRLVIHQACDHLQPNGWLMVEHGYNQGQAVDSLFRRAEFRSMEMVKDLGDQPRVTLGQKGAADGR
jgi:release factor glutamine methyltransferase